MHQHVRNFALRRKKITPAPAIVKPLQVLALEAALLAGISVDEETLEEVSWLLESSYPSFEHIEKNERTTDVVEDTNRRDCGACLCDACLKQLYDNGEADVEEPKSFWDPIECVGPIGKYFRGSLQEEMLMSYLVERLFENVPLWVAASGQCHYLYIATKCRAQSFDSDRFAFRDPAGSDIGSPLTQIERWAFIKLSTILQLEFDDWRGGKEPRLVLASYAYPRSIPRMITIRLRR